MSIQRANADLTVYRGDTEIYGLQVIDVDENTGVETPIDITEATIKGQVRYSSDSDIWFELPITKLDPTNGICEIRFTADFSASLLPVGSIEPDTAIYDVQIERAGEVFTFLYGKFTITRDITRV